MSHHADPMNLAAPKPYWEDHGTLNPVESETILKPKPETLNPKPESPKP